MLKKNFLFIFCLILLLVNLAFAFENKSIDSDKIVKACFNYMRDEASQSTVEMLIKRPSWERTMTIKAWTKGEKNSLFRIFAPAKDKGNGTLKKGRQMWMFNPKINRVIKLPPSMMSQAWNGSDFSNNDLAKTDSLINDYNHTIIKTETDDKNNKIYYIKSIPKPEAPVVWGMLKLTIREDNILLKEEFFDEDFISVKKLITYDIQMISGKLYPIKWKMQKSDQKDEYTLLTYKKIEFKKTIPSNLFTLSELKRFNR